MDTTKIRLSPEEEALVSRTDWILTKNSIIEKIKTSLATLQHQQQRTLDSLSLLSSQEFGTSPKISKGENYQGLPYLVLDYPRFFDKENIFAIRTFFWWGHFFSITLQLAGTFKAKYEDNIVVSFDQLKSEQFHVCINDDPWQHDFEASNYVLVEALSFDRFKKNIQQKTFIKLAKKITIIPLHEAEENLLAGFDQLIGMLKNG